jgi:hypothetical protein
MSASSLHALCTCACVDLAMISTRCFCSFKHQSVENVLDALPVREGLYGGEEKSIFDFQNRGYKTWITGADAQMSPKGELW